MPNWRGWQLLLINALVTRFALAREYRLTYGLAKLYDVFVNEGDNLSPNWQMSKIL